MKPALQPTTRSYAQEIIRSKPVAISGNAPLARIWNKFPSMDRASQGDSSDCRQCAGDYAANKIKCAWQHLAVLQEANGLVLEGRKSGVASDQADGEKQAPVGIEPDPLLGEGQKQSDDKTACHVDNEGPIGKGRTETSCEPAAEEITGDRPYAAAESYQKDLQHLGALAALTPGEQCSHHFRAPDNANQSTLGVYHRQSFHPPRRGQRQRAGYRHLLLDRDYVAGHKFLRTPGAKLLQMSAGISGNFFDWHLGNENLKYARPALAGDSGDQIRIGDNPANARLFVDDHDAFMS